MLETPKELEKPHNSLRTQLGWNFPRLSRVTVLREAPLMIERMLVPCLLAVAFAAGAAPARANSDAVHFGTNIYVAPNATVHDAVCFFCSVNVEGKVNGDIVVFFGTVHIAGSADRDVVNFFGGVRADDGASIGRDMVSFFGAVNLGEDVSIGHDMVAMLGSVHMADSVSVGNDHVVTPGWMLDFPLVLMLLVLILVVREYRSWRRRQFFRNYPFPPPPY
jgi:hypothetical protein